MRQAFAPQPALAEQSLAPIENPYKVIGPIRTLRRQIGLTSNDLVTLQALISFLPKKNGQVSARMSIVFPSNASLSERTNGLDERTIRRCICRLVTAGLIQRRDSATRKRFPLRYGGVIRDAFGFDLTPMYRREDELRAWAKKIEVDNERLRSLRAEALALRVEALKQVHDKDALAFLTSARNILRRATVKLQDIVELIKQMNEMIGKELNDPEFPAGNPTIKAGTTDKKSGTDGQNVRHVEPTRLNINNDQQRTFQGTNPPTVTKNPKSMAWTDFKNLSEFFPKEPRDTESVLRIITSVGSLLRISSERLMCHLRSKGPGHLLIALDAIIGKAEVIRNPSSYLEKLMTS